MPWSAIGQVTSVLSLVAFVAACLVEMHRRRMLRQERLIGLLPEEERSQQVETVLDRFSVKTTDLTKDQRYRLARKLLEQRAERFRLFVVVVGLAVFLGVGLAVYAYTRPEGPYRVRVTVLDPNGLVASQGVEIEAPGDIRQDEGSWEVVVPSGTVPVDGKVVIYARKDAAFLAGRAEVTLGQDRNPVLTIQLTTEEVLVRGLVIDEEGRAVEGAVVSVVGYPETMTTGASGNFELPAHAGEGQMVQLHVEKEGYRPSEKWHPAGRASATLELRDAR